MLVQSEKTKDELAYIHREVEKLNKKYADVFSGVGCLKNFKASLKLKEGAKPPIIRSRPIPVHLEKPTLDRINECVSKGLYTWVSPNTPVIASSPIHPIKKRNSNDIRITIDY